MKTAFFTSVAPSLHRFVASYVKRIHHDTRGAFSIIIILFIMSLVALIGTIWNTTEQAKHRQRIQTAADASAHAAGTILSRALNTIAAENMSICNDASTETLWLAVKGWPESPNPVQPFATVLESHFTDPNRGEIAI